MSYFGRNSMMCKHGDEDGKCGYCYDEWKETGIKPVATMTFGEYEESLKPKDEVISIAEQVRRKVVALFMTRSEERHHSEKS